MRILLLSAYDAHSHRRWRQGLVAAFPEWRWTVLTLPPRFFSWRVRGNSLSWAFSERETLEQSYDVLVATSMTDLSALKGLVPALVYCHENQFAYPDRLAYPEFFPDTCRYPSYPDDPGRESRVIAEHLQRLCARYDQNDLPAAPDVHDLSWACLFPAYRAEINGLT